MSERDPSADAQEWVPAFEGQRPPFQPGNDVGRQFESGNQVSLRHGVYSPRVVDPMAQELVDQVLRDPGTAYLQAAHWRPALYAWARAEVEVQLLTEYLAKAGELSGDGVGDLGKERVNRAYLLKHRAETRATTQRTRLGLDPLSAARLGRDKTAAALDAAQLMNQLAREERERIERSERGSDDG